MCQNKISANKDISEFNFTTTEIWIRIDDQQQNNNKEHTYMIRREQIFNGIINIARTSYLNESIIFFGQKYSIYMQHYSILFK